MSSTQYKKLPLLFITILAFFFPHCSFALTFDYPISKNQLIGKIYTIQSKKKDTLYKVARHYEMGFYEVTRANPHIPINKPIKENTQITIPALFIVPDKLESDTGIIVNLPEMRLYYYSLKKKRILTEPVAVGRPGWYTPTMNTKVVEKIRNPEWVVPPSIAAYYARKNQSLPPVIRPGFNNPLGQYALRLGRLSILIHGTNEPITVGRSISSGCMRMYPEDIAHLFQEVERNTPVSVINQPYKAGWLDQHLYLEIHPPLKKDRTSRNIAREQVHDLIKKITENQPHYKIDWEQVENALVEQSGVPHLIGKF